MYFIMYLTLSAPCKFIIIHLLLTSYRQNKSVRFENKGIDHAQEVIPGAPFAWEPRWVRTSGMGVVRGREKAFTYGDSPQEPEKKAILPETNWSRPRQTNLARDKLIPPGIKFFAFVSSGFIVLRPGRCLGPRWDHPRASSPRPKSL